MQRRGGGLRGFYKGHGCVWWVREWMGESEETLVACRSVTQLTTGEVYLNLSFLNYQAPPSKYTNIFRIYLETLHLSHAHPMQMQKKRKNTKAPTLDILKPTKIAASIQQKGQPLHQAFSMHMIPFLPLYHLPPSHPLEQDELQHSQRNKYNNPLPQHPPQKRKGYVTTKGRNPANQPA